MEDRLLNKMKMGLDGKFGSTVERGNKPNFDVIIILKRIIQDLDIMLIQI